MILPFKSGLALLHHVPPMALLHFSFCLSYPSEFELSFFGVMISTHHQSTPLVFLLLMPAVYLLCSPFVEFGFLSCLLACCLLLCRHAHFLLLLYLLLLRHALTSIFLLCCCLIWLMQFLMCVLQVMLLESPTSCMLFVLFILAQPLLLLSHLNCIGLAHFFNFQTPGLICIFRFHLSFFFHFTFGCALQQRLLLINFSLLLFLLCALFILFPTVHFVVLFLRSFPLILPPL
mmetsp:Transcript_27692/g.40738  ORF Transcript_27692/g.40738 Transcript_27692/m.40738 type:complete len:232 (+) Transcript_27692:1108-1803(+)